MKYCYQVESDDFVESVVENRSVSSLIPLDRDPKGYPLVPKDGGNLENMKRIIRSFITAHYRKDNLLFIFRSSANLLFLRFCVWSETGSGAMETIKGTYIGIY